MSEYEPRFAKAPLWALIWRMLLSSLGIVIIGVFLSLAFRGEHFTLISLITDSLIYFALYKITISQMEKHNLAVKGLSAPYFKMGADLTRVLLVTLLTAVTAYSFFYFLLTVLAFLPGLFDRLVPYILDITFAEDISLGYLFVIAVLIAPVVEEIFFRGYLLNKWADMYGVRKGIVFSSVAFMAIHVRSLFLPQLLVGLLCSLVYVKFSHLIYPILLHMLYNLLVLLASVWFSYGNPADLEETVLALRGSWSLEYLIPSIIFVLAFSALTILFTVYFQSLTFKGSPYSQNVQLLDQDA
ncbi:CAAX amino terminal protease family [Alkalibacterium sp. AK22]|uniref:CPBP family intramembrane glutamic endopeptidase n=1 Tax=Alkalibacterium sp. AK22 TaxID=1229520 RepID=UPI00044E28E3|nr:CPBP family intramembrane glutamic endopeptidase [Alkalibacterium sp. AK22]EXJ22690.1 CAAX amino terminal protease family [Alkalibacterium sp. AK22]